MISSIIPNLPTHTIPTNIDFKLTVTDNGFSMQNEKERLKTYNNWKVSFISKQSLVEDGFYYTGKEDIVKCAFCQIEIGYWEMGDTPNTEHKRWNPNCPLIKGTVTSNGENSTSSGQVSMDDCGFNIEHGQRMSDVALPSLLNTLGIETGTNISYSKYALLDQRLESFKDWPISIKQKPKDLAGAGFFYTGSGDQTICFHCGIGLKDWQENDEPWEEHALWSSKCLFLRLQKGADYINQVLAKNSAVLLSKGNSSTAAAASAASSSTNGTLAKSTCSSLNISIPGEKSKKLERTSYTKTKDHHEDYVGNVPLCGICYVNERSILYLPCRHMIACVDCGTTATTCPVCRQEVKAYVKAIMS